MEPVNKVIDGLLNPWKSVDFIGYPFLMPHTNSHFLHTNRLIFPIETSFDINEFQGTTWIEVRSKDQKGHIFFAKRDIVY